MYLLMKMYESSASNVWTMKTYKTEKEGIKAAIRMGLNAAKKLQKQKIEHGTVTEQSTNPSKYIYFPPGLVPHFVVNKGGPGGMFETSFFLVKINNIASPKYFVSEVGKNPDYPGELYINKITAFSSKKAAETYAGSKASNEFTFVTVTKPGEMVF